ncbi:MAG: carbohydrate kinase [Deltaproteobacteria bacterium]|nr:carbohydrate kinase [Deltaproteobacteria bacterium]
MSSHFIGFDCGTQGTKVAIYSEDSTLVAEAFREHRITYPKPGWAEMDPEQFYQVVCQGIAECLAKAKIDPASVKGISCSGIICGLVPIDQDWNPQGPYIPYLDGRSCDEAARISREVEPLWQSESGNVEVGPFMPPVMLTWLMAHQPELVARSRKFVTNSQFVMGKLGGLTAGEAYMDWGNLSGWIIGYDAARRDWSDRQLDLLGLPRELLPPVVDPASVVGTLSPAGARDTGLPVGIPLVAGSGDIMQANLGCGVLAPGQSSDVAGTASIFTVNVAEIHPGITPVPGVIYSMGTLAGQYLYWGYIRAGGLSLGWLKEEVMRQGGEEGFFRAMDELAAAAPLGSLASLFYPFLQGGDASLPGASAAWLGLTGASGAGSMWRSMLEGICFEYLGWVQMFRQQGIAISEVIGTGGGSKSPLWNQIKADMLGADYVTLQRAEGSVLGDALLAAHGVGAIPDLAAAAGCWAAAQDRYCPRPAEGAAYQKVYQARQRILEGPLRQIFTELAALQNQDLSANTKE